MSVPRPSSPLTDTRSRNVHQWRIIWCVCVRQANNSRFHSQISRSIYSCIRQSDDLGHAPIILVNVALSFCFRSLCAKKQTVVFVSREEANSRMQCGGIGTHLGSAISNGSYSFANPVFSSLAGYSSVALLKMLGMSAYTIVQRFRTSNFATPEDDFYKQVLSRLGLSASGTGNTTGSKINAVERARNNHFNDLENIIPFVLIGLFYVGTRPRFDSALWHFRIFVLSRLLHTIAYQVKTLGQITGFWTPLRDNLGSTTPTDANSLVARRLFEYHFYGHPHPSFLSFLTRWRRFELTLSYVCTDVSNNK